MKTPRETVENIGQSFYKEWAHVYELLYLCLRSNGGDVIISKSILEDCPKGINMENIESYYENGNLHVSILRS